MFDDIENEIKDMYQNTNSSQVDQQLIKDLLEELKDITSIQKTFIQDMKIVELNEHYEQIENLNHNINFSN